MNIQKAICHGCAKQGFCEQYRAFRHIQNLYDLLDKSVRNTLEWLIGDVECPHKIVEEEAR